MASDPNVRIRVASRFQRSVQLESDLKREDALDGYISQASPRHALSVVAEHINASQQRAFTWTGPYGGGKSTLALALAQLASGTASIRKKARITLNVEIEDGIWKAFGGRKPWITIPVVGRRQTIEDAIAQAIDKFAPQRGPKRLRDGRRDVVAELIRRAESPDHGGVLLILDELGKLLEAAASAGEDIYILQELAEAASRCQGKLVLVGVLHQSFEQYVHRSARGLQSEWAKVQGRFVDIPVVAGTDEVIALIGGAIQCDEKHPASRTVAKTVANAIQRRRPASSATLAQALDRCWPLHPVTAALLGPCSRRRFGQNERSIFGFLGSAEPLGFREFLAGHTRASIDYYEPARFWDYLRSNFEPAILASADGHRWATSAEAIERVEARFAEPHVSLAKTVAVIELFRNGSGLTATDEILEHAASGFTAKAIAAALRELAAASIIIHRRHSDAWAVYAGSDFDIDAAVEKARREGAQGVDDQLRRLGALPLVTARKHYSKTGTLRWFERVVTTPHGVKDILATDPTRAGRFLLLVSEDDQSAADLEKSARDLARDSGRPLDVFGVPTTRHRLFEYASELSLLEHVVGSDPALESDTVARREIKARLQQLSSDLDGALRDAFATASWFVGPKTFHASAQEGLAPTASRVCDAVFKHAPHVFSELVNREILSSSAAKAQRQLMHRMLSHGDQAELGYIGYPAEAGLYYTILSALGLHRALDSKGRFCEPDERTAGGSSLARLWNAWRELLIEAEGPVTLARWYDLAKSAPYGVKAGVLPVLALAFLLAHRSEMAIYVEDVFCPELTAADVDEWLQDPTRIAWKWVHIDGPARDMLTQLAECLADVAQRPVSADPLDSARALVAWVLALPAWTQRTSSVSDIARETRRVLLRASDPVKTIFVDLPEVLGTGTDGNALVRAIRTVVTELTEAYPRALAALESRLLDSIDARASRDLQARAKLARGISGNLKLEAFISRLTSYAGADEDIESLAALAANKPPREFSDHDLDHAMVQLSQWAFEFRRIEALASVRGRPSGRRALAVVFGGRDTRSVTVDVSEDDGPAIARMRDRLLVQLRAEGSNPDVIVAALVDAGVILLGQLRTHDGIDHE